MLTTRERGGYAHLPPLALEVQLRLARLTQRRLAKLPARTSRPACSATPATSHELPPFPAAAEGVGLYDLASM